MSSEELLTDCRYCLERDDPSNMLTPCRCSGNTKYVHEKCLMKWFRANNRQYGSCEICQTEYRYKETEINVKTIFCKLFQRMFSLSILFFISYLLFGWMTVDSELGMAVYFFHITSHFARIVWSGFILVHIALFIGTFLKMLREWIVEEYHFPYWRFLNSFRYFVIKLFLVILCSIFIIQILTVHEVLNEEKKVKICDYDEEDPS